MEFLFLPSHLQRRKANGKLRKPRLFLKDGTELVGISSITVGVGLREVIALHADGTASYGPPGPQTLTIEFASPKVKTVSKVPKKTA